jgi:hypothetical protein
MISFVMSVDFLLLGVFTGVCILCDGGLAHSVCSLFVCRANKKSNLDETVRVLTVCLSVCLSVCMYAYNTGRIFMKF